MLVAVWQLELGQYLNVIVDPIYGYLVCHDMSRIMNWLYTAVVRLALNRGAVV